MVGRVGTSDVRVPDPLVVEEIELYTELVIAATGRSGALSTTEIDEILGLRAPRTIRLPLADEDRVYVDLRTPIASGWRSD